MPSRRTAAARTVVRQAAAPPVRVSIARSVGAAAGRGARRAGSALARGASEEKHRIAAVVAAGLLGLAKRSGINLPSIGPLGTSGTAAMLAYGVHKMTGSRMASHAATGLACVAAYSLAREGSVAGGTAVYEDD